MKPRESSRIKNKSIRGNSGDSWPVWNRGIRLCRCTGSSKSLVGAYANLYLLLDTGLIQDFVLPSCY